MGRILGEDDVTCELAWGKPEREVWWLIQLELSVDPVRRKELSAVVPGEETGPCMAGNSKEKLSPGYRNYEA